MSEITVPDGWNEIDTEFSQQERAFQRGRDGLVLSVESGTTRERYAVSFLPENFVDDNQAIRSYGDEGYLYSGDSLEEALSKAEQWMGENPR